MLARREVNWKVDIFAKVKALISEQLDIDEDQITLDTTFEDIDADSLDVVELVMALEEEFDLEIADEEVEKIQTVGDVVGYIEKHLS
ncbi:MAG: acyl carrier protein [Firmicutes bacterium]|nr:acyl carrier protein [Bacillota bacterium]